MAKIYEGGEPRQDADEIDDEIDEEANLPAAEDDDEEDEAEAQPGDGGFSAYTAEDLENAQWLGYNLADLKFQMLTRPKGFRPPTPSELREAVAREKAQYAAKLRTRTPRTPSNRKQNTLARRRKRGRRSNLPPSLAFRATATFPRTRFRARRRERSSERSNTA